MSDDSSCCNWNFFIKTEDVADESSRKEMWFNCSIDQIYDIVEPSWPMETDQPNLMNFVTTEKY